MLTQAHIYVIGDVIGVGFRAWTKIQAKLNNVNGWVRNNHERPEVFGPQGGVEAVFQGEEEHVKTMIDVVRAGPDIAYIEDVEVMLQEPKEVFETFEIRK